MKRARVFAPATIGNVGPGFDVLGLAVDGLGDVVEVQVDTVRTEVFISGRDAAVLPKSAAKNAAAIAARAYLRSKGYDAPFLVSILKGLPVSGGLGGSAASSVGGALAAAYALGKPFTKEEVLLAAVQGEAFVAGRHFDNLAPCLYGGLTCVVPNEGRAAPNIGCIRVKEDWWLALVSPSVRLETKSARAVLPKQLVTKVWVQQMANTAALVHAFAEGDAKLAARALDDRFAEPARARLIPNFAAVKRAALKAGALGASISGAGPTVFALCETELLARTAGKAMQRGFGKTASTVHVGRIDTTGARKVDH
jgi:homoserine kinase